MKELNLNESVVDSYLVFQLLRKLTTPFNKMDAFKLGIIDEHGTILKKRSQLTHTSEFEAYTLLDRVVINLKRLIAKLPGGESKIASYAAALWLLRESKNLQEYENDGELFYESVYDYMVMVKEDKKKVEKFFEDGEGITNNVGTGNIAGTGHDGQDPLVPRNAQKKLMKRKKFTEFVEDEKESKK